MQKLFVFLIDDDADDQEIFEMALKEIQPTAQCTFAADGIFALEQLHNHYLPHVIFIDINMPRMNGIQCLAEIKKAPGLAAIPAFMYSTSADDLIVKECLSLGASGFIKKEVYLHDLQQRLMQALRQVNMYAR